MEPLLVADAAAYRQAADDDLSAARHALSSLKALPASASVDAVALGWDAIGACLDRTSGLSRLLFDVHPDGDLRAVAGQVAQDHQRFLTEVSLDRQLFDRISGLDLGAASAPDTRRLLEHALRDFRRAGVDREQSVRERVTALKAELVELGQAFRKAIAADVRTLHVRPDELAGLPDDFCRAHPPGADGLVAVTTDPPDLIPFLSYAENRERRIELGRLSASRAPENLPVLDRLVAARHELAGLLGYPHWAAYVTETKMIGTAEAAADFIAQVTELAGPRAEAEMDDMRAELARACGQPTEPRDGDRVWLLERMRVTRHAFDARDARPYLAYESVLAGVFDAIERLYGTQVVERPDLRCWHEHVRAFDLTEQGAPIARFFLDMHPRPGKFKHAAMFDTGTRGLPRATLACNLPRPTDRDPALLDPSQVKTLFHEFGHLLHHLLAGGQRYQAFAGIATEWDFVEVPSQLFEEWGRHPAVLARFARHHETGAPMPVDLVRRMNEAEACGRGISTRMQMLYASYSLECFRRDPAGLDTSALMAELKPRFVDFPSEPGTAFQASFGHLDGYSALYYTYMWSLSLAKDCWAEFGEDPGNADAAARWRATVLEPGGSRDASDLLAVFLGRPPELDAFRAWVEGA